MERTIRNSAKALIIKEGRMLAIKIKDKDEVTPKELVFVIEGVHGEVFHRVDLVFLCEYVGEIPDAALHKDKNQIGYDWLDIHTLNHSKLYPSKLRRQIMNLSEGKPYKVYLGNEEVGDPEWLE